MDIRGGIYKDEVVGESDILLRLAVIAVGTIIILCLCCYGLRKVTDDKTSDTHNMDRREIPDIDLERRTRRSSYLSQQDFSNFECFNNDIDTQSDSEGTVNESLIGNNGNEYVIFNAHDAADYDGGTFTIENVSDMICKSSDEKGITNIANTGDTKSKRGEDTIDKCDSAIDISDQRKKNQVDGRGKRNIGGEFDDAIEIYVESRDEAIDDLDP